MANVVIIGPAFPLRGGLATFNERLARQFIQQAFDTKILHILFAIPWIFISRHNSI